jgi:hypothetical protein
VPVVVLVPVLVLELVTVPVLVTVLVLVRVVVVVLVFVLVVVPVLVLVLVAALELVWVAVAVFELVTVTMEVFVLVTVTVAVQLALGLPKDIPWPPMPDHSQRPTWPTRRQKRLPCSQSEPTSLYSAWFSPGSPCRDCAVSRTTRTLGLRVSAMVFSTCRA